MTSSYPKIENNGAAVKYPGFDNSANYGGAYPTMAKSVSEGYPSIESSSGAYPGFDSSLSSTSKFLNFNQPSGYQTSSSAYGNFANVPSLPPVLAPSSQMPATYAPVSANLNGLKEVVVPLDIVREFLRIAELNTSIKIETCAILAGKLINNRNYIVTTLIVPRQEGHQDRCYMTDELQLFEAQM